MNAGLMGLALAAVLFGASAAAPKLVIPPKVVVAPLASTANPQPLKFERAVVRMKEGQVWGFNGGAILCEIASNELLWSGNVTALSTERLGSVFEEELAAAGFRGARGDSLFDADRSVGGLQVGAAINNIQAKICTSEVNGDQAAMVLDIEWQVFDPLQRQVVARITTRAGGEHKAYSPDGVGIGFMAAFRESSRAFLASEALRAKVLTPPGLGSRPPVGAPMPLRVAASKARKIADVATSVVAVFTGDSLGSGFLVSADGYVLTNDHVVGDAKYVKVRWSDGSETLGEVVRANKLRDVALIKTDVKGRAPLSLRTTPLQPGEAVFAVGTPLDEKFQGSVTKGVVSATRTYNGQGYIQSDVTINNGNSGGPLLDEQGAVVGVCVSGIDAGGAPVGINLFIPIDDALKALALTPAP